MPDERQQAIRELVEEWVRHARSDLAVTDAAVLAPKMDAVILVVRPGETRLASARQAVDQLRRGGANLIGVVLNGIDLKRSRYFGYQYQAYYYIYNSRYAKDEEKRVKEPAA